MTQETHTTTAVETPLDPALEISSVPNESAMPVPVKPPAPNGDALPPELPPHEAAEQADLNRWTPAQIQLLKDTVCRGATDDELRLFLYVCQRRRLDPFTKQIHAIKRRVKEGSRWRDSITFQTGIDAFRLVADRTGKYLGQAPFEWCGEDGVWRDVWLSKDAPKAARCTIYREGFREPIRAVALFDEYVQTVDEYKRQEQAPGEFADVKTGREVPNAMWTQRPAGQLAKCAEALGFRMAFPEELSGLYTNDEMGQADNPSKGAQRVGVDSGQGDSMNGRAGGETPSCPKCGGEMWDNREKKRSQKGWATAPDFRCKNKNGCTGEIADIANPQRPAEQTANGPSSAGSAAPRSDAPTSGSASSSSSGRAASTPDTRPTSEKSPGSSTNSASSGSGSSSATDTIPTSTITRDAVIDWGLGKFSVVQGKRIKDLRWEQLDYFIRNRPSVLPAGWLEAIAKEKALREETGGDERDEDDGGSMQGGDPYTGAGA